MRLFGEVSLSPLSMTKGVNFSSCPDTFGKCYCEVNTVDGIMRAARFTEPCISTEGCISSDSETFTFEGELDPGNSADFNEVYENDDRERFEGTCVYGFRLFDARQVFYWINLINTCRRKSRKLCNTVFKLFHLAHLFSFLQRLKLPFSLFLSYLCIIMSFGF